MTLRLEWFDNTACVTIARPEARNAINRDVMHAFGDVVAQLESRVDLRCAILTAEPPGFIAGGDLKDFATIPSREQGLEMAELMGGIVSRWSNLPCPSIAAIDGDAHGGGCELALACDIRIITRGAKMVFRQTQMGLTPGWGGGQRLARLVGRGRALLLFSTAAWVECDDALRYGLVDEVVDGSAKTRGLELAAKVEKRSPLAVRLTKRAIVEGADMDLEAALAHERQLFADAWASDFHKAAVKKFLNRKK